MRKPRIHIQNGLYHVIVRGNHRLKVFTDGTDYGHYLHLLGLKAADCQVALFAYCLMPNHVHLLVEPRSQSTLSKFMQKLQTAYTVWFNRRHKKVGHLFQGRFLSVLVERETYLLELVRYIHLNPFRAGLERSLGGYPYTSHAQFMRLEGRPPAPVQSHTILGHFHLQAGTARRAYLSFLRDGLDQGHRKDLYDLRSGRILGGESFERKVMSKREENPEPRRVRVHMNVGDAWKAVLLKAKEEQRSLGSVGRAKSRLNEETAFLAVEVAGLRQELVAKHLRVTQGAVSHMVGRFRRKLESEGKVAWWRWSEGLGHKE